LRAVGETGLVSFEEFSSSFGCGSIDRRHRAKEKMHYGSIASRELVKSLVRYWRKKVEMSNDG